MPTHKSPFVTINLIAALLFLAACAPFRSDAPTPTPVDVSAYLTEAEQLTEAEAYSAALAALGKAATLAGNSPELDTAMGQIYLRQRRWQAAEQAFTQAYTADPANYAASLGLAEALLEQGRAVESRFYWRRTLKLDSSQAEPQFGLGKSYLATRDFAAAENAFAKAWLKTPDDEIAWYLAALTAPQDFQSGMRYLLEIENPNPNQAHLLAALEQFTAGSPPAEVAMITGVALIQLGEWNLAHHALTRATELDPNRAEIWAFLGHAQSKLGLPAIASFNAANELEPELPLTPYFEGIYLRQQTLYDLAVERFLSALDLDPGNLGIALETAQTLTEKGDYASAEAWYRSVAEAEPDSVEYQQALTQFYVNRSYHISENGLAEAEKLVKMAPNNSNAFNLLGWAKFQTGDFIGAEGALRAAITLNNENIAAHYHLGRTLDALRRNQDAAVEYEFVVDRDLSGAYRNRILEGK